MIKVFVLICANLLVLPFVNGAEIHYSLTAEIPVERDGGWDYLSVDEAARRLYVAHGDQVTVVDLNSNKVVGEIKDTPGVHGFAIASDLGRGFASIGKEGKIGIVDLKTLATLSKVDAGQNPDAILYNPAEKEVYAFNGKSKSVTVINGKTGEFVSTIPLAGKPEFAAMDPILHRVFVNIEDNDTLVSIDSKTHQIAAIWPIAPGKEATGLSIDLARHRLFLGCHNKLMVMIDANSGKVLDSLAIGAGVDSTWYDSSSKLAYSSNSEGSVSIADASTDKLALVQNLATKPRARTMALDTITQKIYLPTVEYKKADDPKSRSQAIPGTFKILVFGLEKKMGKK